MIWRNSKTERKISLLINSRIWWELNITQGAFKPNNSSLEMTCTQPAWDMRVYLMLILQSNCDVSLQRTVLWLVAKGRTNTELREQFTLRPGTSQVMSHFRAKTPNQSMGELPGMQAWNRAASPTSAPIVKVQILLDLSRHEKCSKWIQPQPNGVCLMSRLCFSFVLAIIYLDMVTCDVSQLWRHRVRK